VEYQKRRSLGDLWAARPLGDIRAARGLTQQQIASRLNVKQATVSKMERRLDMHISTLGHFIEAMGGRLELRAVFSGLTVKIDQRSSAAKRDNVDESDNFEDFEL